MSALAMPPAETTATVLPLDSILHGDALEMLRALPSESVDAIVTDPPAGIAFMGKQWDNPDTFPIADLRGSRRDNPELNGFACGVQFQTSARARQAFIDFLTAIFTEARRVLKPGGHALVWALPRTSHWTGTALEDAGFEVRDCVYHLFGSGFPKSLDVSKALDRAAGAEREVIGEWRTGFSGTLGGYGWMPFEDVRVTTSPATPAARAWDGWGTALKPAVEVWWLCRKPLAEPTIAANVLRYGTGAVHVDACRVGSLGGPAKATPLKRPSVNAYGNGLNCGGCVPLDAGRWPPHLLLTHAADCDEASDGGAGCVDGCPVRALDAQSGIRKTGNIKPHEHHGGMSAAALFQSKAITGEWLGDTGGASRYYPQFYYTPKASRSERNAGCEALPLRTAAELTGRAEGSAGLQNPRASSRGRARQNTHPTVKPIALMRWLIRLITPAGGIVLDPFAGSGTTLVAAIEEGTHFIGIEREAEYVAIASARVAHASRQAAPPVVTFAPDVQVTPARKPATKRQRHAVPDGQLSLFAEAV